MKDSKSTVRYLGFQALTDGSRRFDFSFSGRDALLLQLISIEAPHELFHGPNHRYTGVRQHLLRDRKEPDRWPFCNHSQVNKPVVGRRCRTPKADQDRTRSEAMSEASRAERSAYERPASNNSELSEIAWQEWINTNKQRDAVYR